MLLSPTPETVAFLVFLATALFCLGTGGYLVVLAGGRARRRRLERAAGLPDMAQAAVRTRQANLRRDGVEGRFKQVELMLRRVLPSQEALRARLGRTGYRITLTRYFSICLGLAAFAALVVAVTLGPPLLLALAIGLGVGWLVPRMVVGMLAGRRIARFLQDLPDALDVMVRGLKSGLPITEMISTVAKDFDGPVAEEFKSVSDSIRIGNTLEEALWETAGRIDVAEFNFLAISIGVQRETGGNLTETLRNLSDLLRKRQQMRLKVRALSSEARASAYIVGSLPILMLGVLFALNADYVMTLFVDPRGQILLGAAFASQGLGALVMAKMVRFEI